MMLCSAAVVGMLLVRTKIVVAAMVTQFLVLVVLLVPYSQKVANQSNYHI